jgi:hypothetical protein
MRMLWLAVLAVSLGVAGDATAQQQGAGDPEPYRNLSNGGLNHSLAAFVVQSAPFSAQQVAKTGKTLSDGTNIEHFGHHAIYRDSAGRVRVEQPCGCAPDHEQMFEIYVLDPVAGTMTTWRQGGDRPKVATVTKWVPKTPETVKPPRPVAMNSARPQTMSTVSEEPAQLMDNVPVRVVKVTTVVPAGRSGNDGPITKTHTAWISDDLKLVMMEQWEDPRAATRTVGLAQFDRKEPSATLFQPPPGYTVRTAKQSVEELQQKLSEAAAKM